MSRAARLYLLALVVGVLPISAVAIAGCGGGGTTTVTEVQTVTDETTTAEEDATGEEETTTVEESTSGGEETSGGVETTGGDETNGGEEPVTLDLESFQSPSGNIGCILFEGNARCDIDKHGWTPPPRPASCTEQVDYGQGLTVEREGEAGVVCAGDTALNAKDPVLPYTSATEIEGTLCVSQVNGITCTNAEGHGFFISVQGYKLF
jgi:hypothetical protein